MTTLSARARPEVSRLLHADEDQLYEQLGIRARAIVAQPQLAGEFAPIIVFDELAMGPLDVVRNFGQQLFGRWSRECYGLICGAEARDGADRKELLDAFRIDETTVAAALAGFLVAQLALAPAVAGVIAVLLVKRFFRPAHEEFCAVWKEKLGKPA